MKREITAIALMLFIALGCGDYKSKKELAEGKRSSTSKTWSTINTWSGDAGHETEMFNVKSSEWRITVDIIDTGRGNESEITVFAYNEQGRIAGEVDVIGKGHKTKTNGISYVHSPPGRYYLKIISLRNSWIVTVEDQR